MTIAIDIDNTWTEDPILWRAFSENARAAGHTIIIATARKPSDTDDFPRLGLLDWMPVVFSSGNFKRSATEKAGYKVDIWIDDSPSMVDGGLLLNFEDKDL